jgi:cytochrome c-type biogenesis protein CcmH/NrfG
MRQTGFMVFVLLLAPTDAAAQDSLAVLRQAVFDHPKDGGAWVRLGYAYLAVDSLTQAEDAFQKAEGHVKSSRVYNGLGLVLSKKDRRFARKAFRMFRKALQIDPMSLETQMSIARTHVFCRESATLGSAWGNLYSIWRARLSIQVSIC